MSYLTQQSFSLISRYDFACLAPHGQTTQRSVDWTSTRPGKRQRLTGPKPEPLVQKKRCLNCLHCSKKNGPLPGPSSRYVSNGYKRQRVIGTRLSPTSGYATNEGEGRRVIEPPLRPPASYVSNGGKRRKLMDRASEFSSKDVGIAATQLILLGERWMKPHPPQSLQLSLGFLWGSKELQTLGTFSELVRRTLYHLYFVQNWLDAKQHFEKITGKVFTDLQTADSFLTQVQTPISHGFHLSGPMRLEDRRRVYLWAAQTGLPVFTLRHPLSNSTTPCPLCISQKGLSDPFNPGALSDSLPSYIS